MQEIWKDIPGYEGMYQASTLGTVRSIDRNVENLCFRKGFQSIKGRKLNYRIDRYGYYNVRINLYGVRKTYRVNRIIWFTFMGGDMKYYNPREKTVVCHINHDRKDNRLENLYLGTQKENILMSSIEGRMKGGKCRVKSKDMQKERIIMVLIYKTGKYTKTQISERFGYHHTYLGKVLKGIL